MENTRAPELEEFEIDLSQLAKILIQRKKQIILTTLVFFLGGIVIALAIPNKYTAYTIISPRSNESASSLSQFTARLGQLASSAGMESFTSSSANSAVAIEILRSRVFLTEFVDIHNLVPPLFATKGWDDDAQQWIYDSSVFDSEKGSWKPEATPLPTNHQKYSAMKNILEVVKQKDTGFYEIRLTTASPTASHEWLTQLVDDINEHMRKRTLTESKKSIEYLTRQINEARLTEIRSLFYALLEREIQNQMLANAKQSYVFTVIDPSVIPEKKSSPNRMLIIFGAAFIGLLIGLIYAALSHPKKRD